MDDLGYLNVACLEELRGLRGWSGRGTGLWARGNIDALRAPCVAIVGTRAATPYGKRLARTFAADLARAGCTIVSGLALGIDAAAHEGALEAGGATAGILGSGHARFFPKRNAPLAQRMLGARGAVLSPFAPDTHAVPHMFLIRNGIVAALSDAVVVIEAPARSGALNTAGWAADRIPVLAVPGDVDRAHVAGCLSLIRDGATLARDANDVLEALALDRLPLRTTSRAKPADPLQSALVDALAHGELDLDAIVATVDAAPAAIVAALAVLELEGRIERRDAMRFACNSA